jgi:DNA-binding GntR family transcriptional regulator
MSLKMRRDGAISTASAGGAEKMRFEPLDRSSFTPLYFQIHAQLLRIIQSGRLRAGDLLPSEEELSRNYKVSRMTVRQALQMLKSQGLATRHRGQGSFVTRPRLEKDIAHLCGFSAEMRALGMKASSRVLEAGIVPASPEVAAQLHIAVGAAIFLLRRLRLSDDSPVAIEQSSLPRERMPGIERVDFSRRSLYQILRERYGVRFSRADEVLEARSARQSESALLETPPRASLLVISRTLWSADGYPIEAAHSIYRGDRYRAVLRIPATA